MTKKISCYILLGFILLSCTSSEGKDEIGRETKYHPTDKNIPQNTAYKISKNSIQDVQKFRYLNKLKESNYKTKFFIGDDTEGTGELLGEIESIVFTDDNKILVLDSRKNKILIYDKQGNLINSFGRSGRGPGEFMSPEGMVLSSDNKIILIDRFNKVNIYQYANGTIGYKTTIHLHYVPVDICVLNDKFIVRGIKGKMYANATILHAYSTESLKHLKSFGKAYKSSNWLVVNQLSDGPIACHEKSNSIIVNYEYLPFIYSYSLDGKVNWISSISDFNALKIKEYYRGNNPAVNFSKINGVSEMGRNLKSILRNKIIYQTRKSTKNDEYTFLTYAISVKDGNGIYLGNDIPVIYAENDYQLAVKGSLKYPSFKLINIKDE